MPCLRHGRCPLIPFLIMSTSHYSSRPYQGPLPPPRPPKSNGGLLVGFFALALFDGLVIKHLALTLGEALLLAMLAVVSAWWGCQAAINLRLGGDQ